MEKGNCEKQEGFRRQREASNMEESEGQEVKAIKNGDVPLKGSAWCTEKKYIRRYKRSFVIFFGIQHKMRKEETTEQFKKETKQGWRFAADASRVTNENASREDRKRTSAGVFGAIDVIWVQLSTPDGAVTSILGKEGRIAQAWVSVRGMRVLAVELMEAVVKLARTTRYPWLVACDANMNPKDFKKSLWFKKKRCMFMKAPEEGITTERSKGPDVELIERTYDDVIASQSLQGKIEDMEVVEDFESRPHKTVSFLVERDKDTQELCELKVPTALPGCSGG